MKLWQPPPSVVIVGTGVLGLTTALALARCGVRIAVVDGAEEQTCPHCLLHAYSVDWLTELGLEDVLQEAQRIDTVELYSKGQPAGSLSLRAPNGGGSAAVASRATLQRRLLKALAENELGKAGMRTKTGAWLNTGARRRLGRIDTGSSGVIVELEELEVGAAGYSVAGVVEQVSRIERLEPRLVWALDGSHSLVCRQLDVARDEVAPSELYASVEVETDASVGSSLVLDFDEKLKSSVWPLGSHRLRLFVEVDAETGQEGARLDDSQMMDLIHRRLPWLPAVRLTEPAVLQRYPQQLARRFGARQVWLAGDAAHSMSPVSDFSLNAGMEEARHWTSILADEKPSSQVEGALQRYSDERLQEWRDEPSAWATPEGSHESLRGIEVLAQRLRPSHLPIPRSEFDSVIRRIELPSVSPKT